MLRHLGHPPEHGLVRQGECDPNDSVFVVLLAEDVGQLRSWNVGSVWLTLGGAQGAVNRYRTEGHAAHPAWKYAIVMEYQTGQLAPSGERHGDEVSYVPENPPPATDDGRIAELELELNKLRAQLGQQQTVGAK